MANVIVPANVSVSADGKTVTGSFGGGTAPYSFTGGLGDKTNLAQLGIKIPQQRGHSHLVTDLTTDGTTWTATLTTTIGQGETVPVQWAGMPAGQVTDAAGNDRITSGAANITATNNSTVPVRTIDASLDGALFDHGGPLDSTNAALSNSGGAIFNAVGRASTWPHDNWVEFVTDASEVHFAALWQVPVVVHIDGATTATTATRTTGVTNASVLHRIGLPGDGQKHLVQVVAADSLRGWRLVGGTRSMTSVARRRASMKPLTTGGTSFSNYDPRTTPVAVYGEYQWTGAAATVTGTRESTVIEFGFTGSGFEYQGVAPFLTAVELDGNPLTLPRIITSGGAGIGLNNVNTQVPIVDGLTNAAHTVSSISVSGAGTMAYVCVNNGSVLGAATSAGATNITIADPTHFKAGDWLRIDYGSNREHRRIETLVGGTATLNAALTQAHASGAHLTSLEAAAAPPLTAYSSRSRTGKVVLAVGDSNTHGYNYPGQVAAQDVETGLWPSGYDPRYSPMHRASLVTGAEVINTGVQGTRSNVHAGLSLTTKARTNLGAAGGADVVTVWTGTNDVGGGTTPAAYKTNVQTIVTNALAALRPGGMVLLMPPATPSTTNGVGLNVTTMTQALHEVAAANPNTVVMGSLGLTLQPLVDKLNDDLHYSIAGQKKVAAQLVPYFTGHRAPTQGFFAA